MINIINDAGAGVIGTPEQARAQVQRLWDQSGGFGCMLQMGHEWANPAATKRSAELFAAEVMPHFQGQAQPTVDAAARASEVRDDLAQIAASGNRPHDEEVPGRSRLEVTLTADRVPRSATRVASTTDDARIRGSAVKVDYLTAGRPASAPSRRRVPLLRAAGSPGRNPPE